MNVLGVFAKYWEPGEVKTRLAATLGGERASEIYLAFLRTTLGRFAGIGDRRVLACTPGERGDEFAALDDGWQCQPQADGDLGERMMAFFQTCFDQGAERVVLMGSDSPSLPTGVIESAFERLGDKDVVLGPTADGGYYLVGMRGRVASIFSGIQWSTPQVWPQTVEKLEAAGLHWDSTEPWYDVDDGQDLQRLQAELAESTEPALRSLREQIRSTVGR